MSSIVTRLQQYISAYGWKTFLYNYSPWRFLFRKFSDSTLEKAVSDEPDTSRSLINSIEYFILVWGDSFIEMFLNYTVPSLLQQGNIPALNQDGINQVINIYTLSKGDFLETANKLENFKALSDLVEIEIIELDKIPQLFGFKENSLIHQIERAIRTESFVINASADFFYGDGTIRNLVKTANYREAAVAFSHCRVDHEKIQEDKDFNSAIELKKNITNEKLVSIALSNLHHSNLHAFDNEEKNCTHAGISIRELTPSLFSVTTCLPSVFGFWPTQKDLQYFKYAGRYNEWDRGWNKALLLSSRLKIISSSDVAFMIELTETNEGNHKLLPNQLGNDNVAKTRRSFSSRPFRK